ncbi:nucleoside deaminase [Roseibium sp.]|uniref:nucleoside deaminase n=1 Tax=Roseibium sp. TaxID=1936156 RepID=UPI003D0CC394
MKEMLNLEKLDLEGLMRRAIALAASAREKGNHPFGALLCDLEGNIVLEAENSVGELGDVTCHAEHNLMSAAARAFGEEERANYVMVTSTEPCAMCAGATFWTGIRAVVFGLSEKGLIDICVSGDNPHPPLLNVPCEKVFKSAPHHPTVVIGPVLEDEARVPHLGFWT